jgi:hypothetical protein
MRDPSMEQTAAGLSTTHGIDGQLVAEKYEKDLLRELAKRVFELSARPVEEEKKKLWNDHNDLKRTRPLIFCDPENGWNEIITQDQIKCRNPLLRVWEMFLRKEIFWAEEMKDDKVIEPFFNVPYHYRDTGYGFEERTERTSDEGSCVWIRSIEDYERDFQLLRYPEIVVDHERTEQVLGFAQDIFGNILQVRLRGIWWWTLGMTWDFIKIRGLENLMLDMLVYPDWVHRMMDFLSTSVHRRLDFLEENGLLALNTEGSYVGSGGFGWTGQLPQPDFDPQRIRTSDMWGFAESQETVGIDPEAFGEFIFPYQKTILERFGLNCYGCCEPIDPRWHIVKEIPRLRRVSVSPWASIPKMAEFLEDRYLFSMKPSPTPLSFATIEEESVRKKLREALKMTRDCNVEVIMKDNHTLGKNPMNAVNWCRIAMEEAKNI